MISIGQVAAKAGLRASALRYYEAQGLLPRADRVGGRRVYDRSILDRLHVIQLAKTAGFTLDEIRHLLETAGDRPLHRWKTLTAVKRADVERQMRRLAVMKAVLRKLDGCRCGTIETCGRIFEAALARYRATHG